MILLSLIKQLKKTVFKKYNRSNLICSSKYDFMSIAKLKNSIVFLLLTSKYSILFSLYSDLNQFNNLNPQKVRTKENKATVYDNAPELYNKYLEIYFDKRFKMIFLIQDLKLIQQLKFERKMCNKQDPIDFFLETYNHDLWFKNEDLTDKKESIDLSDIPLL